MNLIIKPRHSLRKVFQVLTMSMCVLCVCRLAG